MLSNKVCFTSLGCPRNLVDSEVMLGLLIRSGYELVAEIEDADFLIVNTCGFLQSARDESCNVIEELFANRKENAKVIVTGCMVNQHKEMVKEKFPHVDFLLGSADSVSILKAIQENDQKEFISSERSFLENGEVPRFLTTPSHYAYLKIAEGCRKRCAFCIIPKIKGPLKSKSVEQVKKEFKSLLNEGVKEVILIAQDLGDFGKDSNSKKGELKELLKALLNEKGEFWLRLLYLYPDEIDNELIEIMKSDKRILPYLDMPIQHVSNTLLKKMRRKTSKEDIIKTIETLRSEIPNIVIRTSLMVGFPGETEKDFNELCNFVKEYKLDNVGVFKFSKEKGALAYTMDEQVDETLKEKRFKKLMKIQKETVDKKNKKYIGKTLDVVIEDYHEESELLMVGRFYGQCPGIDGNVIINNPDLVDEFGAFYQVEVVDAFEYNLVASVIKKISSKKIEKKKGSLALIGQ